MVILDMGNMRRASKSVVYDMVFRHVVTNRTTVAFAVSTCVNVAFFLKKS